MTNKRAAPLLCWLMASAVVVSGGCGNSLGSSVSGKVLIEDEPLTSGIVVFHPQQGGAMPATQIGEDGSYEMRTGGFDGLEPGEYVITVAAGTGQSRAPTSPDELRQQSNTPSRVPLRYSHPDSSPLKLAVEPGDQTFDIVMTSENQ